MSNSFERLCELSRRDLPYSVTLRELRIAGLIRMAANGRDLETPVVLPYFKEPPANAYPMNLMEDFELFVHPPDCVNNLVRLEKFLMLNDLDAKPAKVQFCTQRSCLIDIMKGGVGDFSKFTLYATKFHNHIFLMKYPQTFEPASKYPAMKLKINSFVDSPEMDVDPNRVANESEQTFAIYRAKLMDFDLIYSAEVDGIKADKPLHDIHDMDEINQCEFVRICLLGANAKSPLKRMWKSRKLWLQAYLSNLKDIYLATKDSGNVVHDPLVRTTMQSIETEFNFSAKICCGYLAKWLQIIERTMSNVNCPYSVYEFHFTGKNSSAIEYKIHEGKTELSFLSEEFIEFMEKTCE